MRIIYIIFSIIGVIGIISTILLYYFKNDMDLFYLKVLFSISFALLCYSIFTVFYTNLLAKKIIMLWNSMPRDNNKLLNICKSLFKYDREPEDYKQFKTFIEKTKSIYEQTNLCNTYSKTKLKIK